MAELIRYWPNPTPDELHAHESGAAQFALVDGSPHTLLLAYNYGALGWSDSPFQAHRMTTAEAGWPAGGPAGRILFRTVVVDANNGLVRALRYDRWTEDFSNAVRVSVAEQLISDFDDAAADATLKEIYAKSSTPELMVRSQAVAMCHCAGPTLGGTQPIEAHYY